MKQWLRAMILCSLVITAVPKETHAQAAIAEIIKEGVKKVIKAVDLKIQRLQTQTIWLHNAQKVLENKLSKLKLDQISSWMQKQHDLYDKYYKELWQVKDDIATYKRVKQVITEQLQMVKSYQQAYGLLKQDQHFSPEELGYMLKVYSGMINASLQNLDQVYLVITSLKTQMSDEQRLEIIDKAAEAIEENYSDLKNFNDQNILLSLQRAKDENDYKSIEQLYGLASP